MSSTETGDAIVAILGAGGHAKVVLAAAEACGLRIVGIFDDDDRLHGRAILGHTVVGLLADAPVNVPAVLAFGDNAARSRAAAAIRGRQWAVVVHPFTSIHASVALGDGTVVFAGAVIQPDAEIGEHAIVNTGARVDHDCRIGSFSHIAPGACLAGAVGIGEGSLIGIGASIAPGVTVGARAIVGAGAVVVSDVAPGATVIGVPACPVDRS